MTLERNNLTKAQTMTVAAIEERLPDLVDARDVVESFHDMLRRKSSGPLLTRKTQYDAATESFSKIRSYRGKCNMTR